MEVHSHTHTPRKKFRHYFWEFFMLFLAVTAGFFVENQREHYIEHRREKQYVRSFLNDVRSDTSRLNTIINARAERERRLDSMSYLINGDSASKNANYIYYVAVTSARTLAFRFVPNDGTMQQLKNSGALRLIRNHSVVDLIAKYDVSVRNFMRQGELEESLIADYRSEAVKIFNALEFDAMLDSNNNVTRNPSSRPALLPFTNQDLNEFNYRLYSIKALNKANRRDARLLLKQSLELLKTLKDEYGIE